MTAVDTIFTLRFKIVRPAVTTMGWCPRCGSPSHGGGVCADCLIEDLPKPMQPIARQWRDHAESAERAWWALERMAERKE